VHAFSCRTFHDGGSTAIQTVFIKVLIIRHAILNFWTVYHGTYTRFYIWLRCNEFTLRSDFAIIEPERKQCANGDCILKLCLSDWSRLNYMACNAFYIAHMWYRNIRARRPSMDSLWRYPERERFYSYLLLHRSSRLLSNFVTSRFIIFLEILILNFLVRRVMLLWLSLHLYRRKGEGEALLTITNKFSILMIIVNYVSNLRKTEKIRGINRGNCDTGQIWQ